MEKQIDDELTYKVITAYQLGKGLLINFGGTSLEVKRLFRKH